MQLDLKETKAADQITIALAEDPSGALRPLSIDLEISSLHVVFSARQASTIDRIFNADFARTLRGICLALAPDTTHQLDGEKVNADAALRTTFPDSAIELARSKRPDGGAALTLQWRQIWKSGVALQTAIGLLSGLEVDAGVMAANVPAGAGSERVLAVLTARLGKHEAQARMHEALQPGAGRPAALEEAGLLDGEELRTLLATPAIAGAQAMVDEVAARARAARRVESDEWA